MKKRLFAPGFFTNEVLGECKAMTRLLFAGLTLYCDRDGKFEWRPRRIEAVLFPYDMPCGIDDLLGELVSSRLIARYSVNGKDYGIIPTFLDHQNPHKNEKKSIIPDPLSDPLPEISRNSTESPETSCLSITNTIIKLHSSSSIEAAGLLKDLLLREQPNAKIPKEIIEGKRSWAAEFDRMIRIDNRDPPEILKMIRWLYNENLQNEFQFVVKSAHSLRKKYDNIETQMKKTMPRRVEDPHKDRRCKTCLSWQDTPNWLNEQGYCERCETLPPS